MCSADSSINIFQCVGLSVRQIVHKCEVIDIVTMACTFMLRAC